MAFFIILIIGIISLGCIEPVSAQSAIYVVGTSEGGEFSFVGEGATWDWNLDITGFDTANVDLTNHWIYSTDMVSFTDIGDGEIHINVTDRSFEDSWYYYDWDFVEYLGDGLHEPELLNGGGRSVNVTNSPNVTTFIEQVVEIRKAVFLMDTRHTSADLTVCVHNGELLENAMVILTNGAREVQWTDENGIAEFTPHTGKYVLVIEVDEYDSMLVEDLYFESDKSYRINVNMSDCLSSSGSAFCAASSDDLILFYKNKSPAMDAISPQKYVDYFAERLTTCMAGRDPEASGTLEVMSRKWGIYPTDLGVLLYSCNFTKLRCDSNWCEWEITYEVRNFQNVPYNYTVTLITDGITTELNSGVLDATFSESGRETITKTVVVNCDNNVSSCCGQMYLAVTSAKVD